MPLTATFCSRAALSTLPALPVPTPILCPYRGTDYKVGSADCMELRSLCCATSLYAASLAAKKVNELCPIFSKPEDEQSLSRPFRRRRELHITSLMMLQRIDAVYKVGRYMGAGHVVRDGSNSWMRWPAHLFQTLCRLSCIELWYAELPASHACPSAADWSGAQPSRHPPQGHGAALRRAHPQGIRVCCWVAGCLSTLQ